jgi:hypothetical protein
VNLGIHSERAATNHLSHGILTRCKTPFLGRWWDCLGHTSRQQESQVIASFDKDCLY